MLKIYPLQHVLNVSIVVKAYFTSQFLSSDIFFDYRKTVLFAGSAFYKPPFLIIISLIRLFLWAAKVRSEKLAKKSFKVTELKGNKESHWL